jgi:Uma2 family endonuclease
MAGASREHNLIVANLVSELGNSLKNRPCEVYPSDIRVKCSTSGLYTYPDAVVVCGKAEFEEYVMISQDRVNVECDVRQADDRWLLRETQVLLGSAFFESIQVAIPLTEIYCNIRFETPPVAPVA